MYTYAIVALASLAAAQSSTAPAAAGATSGGTAPSMTAAAAVPSAISPEQSSAILDAFQSYNSYLAHNSYVKSLGGAINTWLPIGSWDRWNAEGFANQPSTTDYLALATATPTYSYPNWATNLPGSLQSEWGGFATSVQVAHESIVRSVLSLNADGLPGPTAGVNQGPIPTANNITVNTIQGKAVQTQAPAALAAAAGAIGLAALAL